MDHRRLVLCKCVDVSTSRPASRTDATSSLWARAKFSSSLRAIREDWQSSFVALCSSCERVPPTVSVLPTARESPGSKVQADRRPELIRLFVNSVALSPTWIPRAHCHPTTGRTVHFIAPQLEVRTTAGSCGVRWGEMVDILPGRTTAGGCIEAGYEGCGEKDAKCGVGVLMFANASLEIKLCQYIKSHVQETSEITWSVCPAPLSADVWDSCVKPDVWRHVRAPLPRVAIEATIPEQRRNWWRLLDSHSDHDLDAQSSPLRGAFRGCCRERGRRRCYPECSLVPHLRGNKRTAARRDRSHHPTHYQREIMRGVKELRWAKAFQ